MEPFDIEGCDLAKDRGIVVGVATLVTFMVVVAVFVVREGDSRVYDRVWDFTLTMMLIHIVLSIAISGSPGNGQWWGVVAGGGLILGVGGYFLSDYYWGMQAQARLTAKMDTVN